MTELIDLRHVEDIVKARSTVRDHSQKLGFGLVDQTRIVTAASELARNTIEHGGGGFLQIMIIDNMNKVGINLVFEDRGKGIDNIELALSGGYSTGSGLGLGLKGSKQLMHDFEINSKHGTGTRVSVTRWKP